MRPFVSSLFCLFLLAGPSPAAEKPNFVFVYMDDLGWADVGFNGSRYYLTPNIDRLAREGIIFTSAYSNAPNCAPSAGAIRRGQWKLIEYFEDGHLELYNLADDMGEKNNLARSRVQIADQLHAQLTQWRKSVNAPVPTKRNPQFDPTFKPRSRRPN